MRSRHRKWWPRGVAVDSSTHDGVAFDDEFLIKAETVLEVASLPLRIALEGPRRGDGHASPKRLCGLTATPPARRLAFAEDCFIAASLC